MTTNRKVEFLLQQIAALREEAQTDFVQALVEMLPLHFGIYQVDDEERATLATAVRRSSTQL
jgi:hypothetical protein